MAILLIAFQSSVRAVGIQKEITVWFFVLTIPSSLGLRYEGYSCRVFLESLIVLSMYQGLSYCHLSIQYSQRLTVRD
jgi:hypothetical protein